MQSDSRCFFCFAQAFAKLLDASQLSRTQKLQFTEHMSRLYIEGAENFSAPSFSKKLHELLTNYTGIKDAYAQVKRESNQNMLALYPTYKARVLQSDVPFDRALRLALAGNFIDFAVHHSTNIDSVLDRAQNQPLAIDHSQALKADLKKTKHVLYLGDNCGEIVLDRIFIETIMHPNLTFVVRGAPVINDATLEDAQMTGLDHVADVIDNGDNAPSTLLAHCSETFKHHFEQADVILSKGQGNLEGLLGKTNKNIYFLLMVKCLVMSELLHVPVGSFVVFNEHKK